MQEIIGDEQRVNTRVRITDGTIWLEADRLVRNTKTDRLHAEGHIFFENLVDGQKLSCEIADYDLNSETGTFYNVAGSAKARIMSKPGLLTTSDPFFFEGEKAEKIKNRYIVHNGFMSDCKPTNLWWRLKGRTFDIIPNDRAIGHHSTLYLKKVPIFYFPAFYKSLKEQPRRSGFLTPSFGNSSQRGQFVGIGYFWAIGRSYDATFRTEYFTKRGVVAQGDFSGWINSRTYFDATAFGAPDYSGSSDSPAQPGGYVLTGNLRTFFGTGWEGRVEVRELSTLQFRQTFTQNFDEAINSETHTVGYIAKHWKDYGFNINGQRNVNYISTVPGNQIVIRKLPEAQFVQREHALGKLPVWVSFDSSGGLNRRTEPSCPLTTTSTVCPQPEFQTWQFSPRLDFAPRISTAAHFFGLDVSPSFAIRETYYGQSLAANDQVVNQSLLRSSRDFGVDLGLPRLSRIFAAPKWLRAGDKVKHVFEARVRYRYVTGIDQFQQTLRFDQLDVISNTNEVEFSITNRLLKRNGLGGTEDFLSWQLFYKRYFDPTFGGAVPAPAPNAPARRYVVESSDLLTGYAFLYGPRTQSPVVSVLRAQTKIGVEWRTDYDPVQKKIVNSTLSMDYRIGAFSVTASQNQLNTNPVLAPKANQFRGSVQYGSDQRRGWNYGFTSGYDYVAQNFLFLFAQTTYNTDCCGFSVQYRRNNFTVLNDNQFRVAFTLANIGSFGTLGRQQRIIY